MLTAHVRAARFTRKHLADMWESGHVGERTYDGSLEPIHRT